MYASTNLPASFNELQKVVTRAGISPANQTLGIGPLRTHLLAYCFAQSARLLGLESQFHIRCDDTNSKKSDLTHLPHLVALVHTTFGITPNDWDIDSENILTQSARHSVYEEALDAIHKSVPLITSEDSAMTFFDVGAYVKKFGPQIKINDIALGQITFNIEEHFTAGDSHRFILRRADGSFVWHLASPVDDHHLGVNLIVRGNDKLSSVVSQEMLRVTLGYPSVLYAHVPLMEKSSGGHLGPKSTIQELIKEGIHLQAIISYLCSSAYGEPEKLYLSLENFCAQFDGKHIHKKNAKFDEPRLRAINTKILKLLNDSEYSQGFKTFVQANEEDYGRCLPIPERFLSQATKLRRDYHATATLLVRLHEPSYEPIDAAQKKMLSDYCATLGSLSDVQILSSMQAFADKNSPNHAEMSPLIRWMILGTLKGPDPFPFIHILFEEKKLTNRVVQAQNILQQGEVNG